MNRESESNGAMAAIDQEGVTVKATPRVSGDLGEHLGSTKRIPLWLKLTYTAFVCVLVPYYWTAYGPTNFLYFCDVALLVTLPALWLENRTLVSVQAVAILVPQMLWVIDFVSHLLFGAGPVGMTDYMFSETIPLFVRGLSSFHGWMPFLLLYLVWKLGYDRRAYAIQCVCGIALLLVCYFFTPAPPAPASDPNAAVNINYVFGLSDTEPQQWMSPGLWLTLLIVSFPTVFYLPSHLVLRKVFRNDRAKKPAQLSV
jgi:hypothetical protein